MPPVISIESVTPRILAAVRQQIQIGQVASSWRPALDQVWAFLRSNSGLRTDDHNIFLYHHPAQGESILVVDFGVQVTRPFPRAGEVFAAETPAGKVASSLHVGPYEKLAETHKAIHAWVAASHAALGGKSCEIYGDWNADPAKLETRVEYLLA